MKPSRAFREVVFPMTMAFCLGAAGIIHSRAEDSEIDPRAYAEIDSLLAKTMKAEEDSLGIKHFGIPRVKLKKVGEGEAGGAYYPFSNFILIKTPQPQKYFDAKKIENILYHELGHFYTDKLSEWWGNGSWPLDSKAGSRILSEGIAEYFRRRFNSAAVDSLKVSWDIDIRDLPEEDYLNTYIGGYLLVKPIIDLYGKKGIEYILTHPILEEDFKNVPRYTERALEALFDQ